MKRIPFIAIFLRYTLICSIGFLLAGASLLVQLFLLCIAVLFSFYFVGWERHALCDEHLRCDMIVAYARGRATRNQQMLTAAILEDVQKKIRSGYDPHNEEFCGKVFDPDDGEEKE